MSISTIATNIAKQAKLNSPELLAAMGVTGVFTTSYLTAKAAIKATEIIDADEMRGGTAGDPKQRFKERAQLVWKLYVPPAISGAVTIVCILGSNQASGRRTAAAVTAFSVTERAFSEYKEKVVEQLGKGPEQKVRNRLVQKKVDANPPSNEVVFVGTGHIIFCEMYTGRYFLLNMEQMKRAENKINELILSDLYVTLSEFYDILGIDHTSASDYLGWDSGKALEIRYTAVIKPGPEPEPCMGFEYNYVKPFN